MLTQPPYYLKPISSHLILPGWVEQMVTSYPLRTNLSHHKRLKPAREVAGSNAKIFWYYWQGFKFKWVLCVSLIKLSLLKTDQWGSFMAGLSICSIETFHALWEGQVDSLPLPPGFKPDSREWDMGQLSGFNSRSNSLKLSLALGPSSFFQDTQQQRGQKIIIFFPPLSSHQL